MHNLVQDEILSLNSIPEDECRSGVELRPTDTDCTVEVVRTDCG